MADVTNIYEEMGRKQIEKSENSRYEVTANMIRLAYTEVILNIPQFSHHNLVRLIELSGGKMGFHHYNRINAVEMVKLIADDMLKQFIELMKTNVDPISIIMDGSTDKR